MVKESTIKLSEILRGCEPGRIQSVGIMQVIPLVSEIVDDRFVSPAMSARVATSDYGTLKIENKSDSTMIVPSQAAYVVKQMAQDHALPELGIVNGKSTKSFTNAMCIQQTQGGLIGGDEHKMIILPFPLREKSHNMRKQTGYDRLWGAISHLNNRAGVDKRGSSQGHLEYFLDAFKDQLDRFVAEFEPVDSQVGAIILINGKIVGIERTPSPVYWKSIWGALIRECYGSLALIEEKETKGKVKAPKTRVPLRKVGSVADLKKALTEATNEEYERVKSIINNIADIDLGQKTDSKSEQYKVEALSHKRFVGQVIREEEQVLYASLVATENWRTHEDWYESEPFKM